MKKHKNNFGKRTGLFAAAFIFAAGILITGCQNKKAEDTEVTEETTAEIVTTEAPTQPAKALVNGEYFDFDTVALDLSGSIVEDVKQLSEELKTLTGLTTVELYDCNLTTGDEVYLRESLPEVDFGYMVSLDGIEYDSRTEEIDISNGVIDDLEVFCSEVKAFSGLNKLIMCDTNLSNEQMEYLMNQVPAVKFVWNVTLGLWTIRTDTVAFSTLKDGSITYRLTNEDCQVLKYCTDMYALDLGHNFVTDISFLQYMPDLKILILVDDRMVGEDGYWDESMGYIQDLSYLKYVPKLVYLEFFVGSVQDLSFLQYLPNLVDLNISYNPISDVTWLLNLPKLQRLFLEHTNLTEEDYALLQATYPNAQVVYYGEGSVDQGWRTHERYYAMKDMYDKNYINDIFENLP